MDAQQYPIDRAPTRRDTRGPKEVRLAAANRFEEFASGIGIRSRGRRRFNVATILTGLLALATVAGLLSACGGGPRPTPTPTALPAVPPAWPFVFNGRAITGGEPVPAGLLVTGRIAEYRSAPVTTQDGRYQALPVGPLDREFFDRPITFELTRPSDGKTVVAEQTIVFRALPEPSLYELDLTFPAFD